MGGIGASRVPSSRSLASCMETGGRPPPALFAGSHGSSHSHTWNAAGKRARPPARAGLPDAGSRPAAAGAPRNRRVSVPSHPSTPGAGLVPAAPPACGPAPPPGPCRRGAAPPKLSRRPLPPATGRCLSHPHTASSALGPARLLWHQPWPAANQAAALTYPDLPCPSAPHAGACCSRSTTHPPAPSRPCPPLPRW